MIRTKSIQTKKSPEDGIRICIMRRPGAGADFDIWMPVLAPSHELLDNYREHKINWIQYEKRFNKEVVSGQKKYLKILIELARKSTVTLLCWEKKPDKCHRRLIAEACQKLSSNIKIVIK